MGPASEQKDFGSICREPSERLRQAADRFGDLLWSDGGWHGQAPPQHVDIGMNILNLPWHGQKGIAGP
jgi:hypothetical protein